MRGEPGRGPVGGTPHPDPAVGPLAANQNVQRAEDVPPQRQGVSGVRAGEPAGPIQRQHRGERAGDLLRAVVGIRPVPGSVGLEQRRR